MDSERVMMNMNCKVNLKSCEGWHDEVCGDVEIRSDRLTEGALLAAAEPVGEPQGTSMQSPHYPFLMPMANLHCRSYQR